MMRAGSGQAGRIPGAGQNTDGQNAGRMTGGDIDAGIADIGNVLWRQPEFIQAQTDAFRIRLACADIISRDDHLEPIQYPGLA